MTDPCGGNTRGGGGCRCDPPFGGTMSETKAPPDFRVRRSPEGWYVDQWGTGWEQVSGPHGARGVAVKSTRPAGAFCEKHWSWLCGKPCEENPMTNTDPWAVIAAIRAEHSAVHDFSEDATRAVGPVYAAMCRSCGWTVPCPTLKLLPPEPTT